MTKYEPFIKHSEFVSSAITRCIIAWFRHETLLIERVKVNMQLVDTHELQTIFLVMIDVSRGMKDMRFLPDADIPLRLECVATEIGLLEYVFCKLKVWHDVTLPFITELQSESRAIKEWLKKDVKEIPTTN